MIQNEKHLLVMYKERIRNFMPKRALEDVAILVGRSSRTPPSPEEVAMIQNEKHLLAMIEKESLEAKMERSYATEEFGNID